MDIESLCRISLRNIQKAPIPRPQIPAQQLLELLEKLQQAENWEQENYSGLNQEQSEDNEPPILIVPYLPSLQALQFTSDNPKEIIFDAFLCEQTIPSLTKITQNKVSLLVKAIPLAVNAQALLPEECNLILHFLESQLYDSLQTFLYQKLMHGYLNALDFYKELVVFLLDNFPSFEAAGEVIKRLPIITDDVWRYIWKNSHNLLHLLRELVLTYEEGSRGIDEIFSMINSNNAEVQSHAISLIVNQLYSICPEEINKKTVDIFIEICLEPFETSNYQGKIKLFFKLLGKNPDLLESLVQVFDSIRNPSHKRYILQVYAKCLSKRLPQNHPVLLRALENSNDIFALDTLNILAQLSSIHEAIKEILMSKAKNGEHHIIPYLAPHLNMEDVNYLFLSIIQFPESIRNSILQSIVEVPSIDACELLVLVHRSPIEPLIIVKIIKELMDMRHIYTSEILQRTTERIIRIDPIPQIIMYFILKANEMYPSLKSFFINYAMPYLLERKVWETSTIWRGCVTFIEKTVPDSIHLLDLMPSEIQIQLLQRESIKKGKLEESLRGNKRK